MDVGGSSGQDSVLTFLSIVPPKPERKRKRLKLSNKEPDTTDIARLRQLICDHKRRCQEELKEVYRDNLTELFYLQNGLNFVDIQNLKKKPNIHLQKYLSSYDLDDDFHEDDADVHIKLEPSTTEQISNEATQNASMSYNDSIRAPSHAATSVSSLDAEGGTPGESIMEQAKKEASVMQRVGELRKKGLWSAKRLPKVQEPIRNKAHWDYLLEEMQWLAADFGQERKWKKAGCRKISRMITRYHQDREDDKTRAKKEEGGRLRRIAGQLAKQIKDFWSNIEKVVQYKHDSRLDEKRRQAMDMQLNFIVDQTEKYSSWLSAGLGASADTSSSRVGSSVAHSPSSGIVQDMEFEPNVSSSDDEETIAKEEELNATDQQDTDAEIAALQAESEMPLEQLLAQLPQEIRDRPASCNVSSSDEHVSSEDYEGDSSDAVDDENTLDEQEQHETQSYNEELEDLKNEGEMTVDELAAKYAGAYASDFELPDTPSSTEVESGDDGDDEDQQTSSDEETDQPEAAEPTEEIGMEYLLHPEKDESEILSAHGRKGSPNRDITDIAAAAQSLQPTGYTLETTDVKTPIPHLLKHTLREYQHVGLDWLATMYDRKLNGILADEMGLGKTIQSIALLAHLACEHGVWGPHLIVVPTSVMLNWELELKKWCPGFKILTYYGSQKERKLKRVGWTKTNAFHVCITSYKLVIQDHVAFRRKKWKYLILDEAQNIKNFKSQRWQTLLNFNSQRRLLLTGTPLQNNLMELWSLMHFLMPHVFQSHMDFKEWFSNPLTGMIEGTNEYNDQLIRRLHKVLRPFLLRRLKADVERQLPKKYEHVVMCRLSKRQRFLYEEFMSRRATKDTLAGGNFMSVINILMQLRKVCNHPDLFDPRPITSPFETEGISFDAAAIVLKALEYEPLKHLKLFSLYPNLANLDMSLSAYAAHRSRNMQLSKRSIELIDDEPDPLPRQPPTKLRPFVIRSPTPSQTKLSSSQQGLGRNVSITSTVMKPVAKPIIGSQLNNLITQTAQRIPTTKTIAGSTSTSQPITLQIQHSLQGAATLKKISSSNPRPAGFIQLIQTSSGQLVHSSTGSQPVVVANSNKVQPSTAVVSSHPKGNSTMSLSARLTSTTAASPVATVDPLTGKPVLRPTNSTLSSISNRPVITSESDSSQAIARTTPVTVMNGTGATLVTKPRQPSHKAITATGVKASTTMSTFLGPASRKRALETEARNKFVADLRLDSLQTRQAGWRSAVLTRIALHNRRNCSHRPVYGFDLHDVVDVWTHGLHSKPTSFQSNSAAHCYNTSRLDNPNHPRYYWNTTSYLCSAILSASDRLVQLKDILERFVFLTPPVKSSGMFLHRSRGDSLITYDQLLDHVAKRKLRDLSQQLHPIQTRMLVQFPEKRLIQYDCGKLQTLDILLRDLKYGKHRVLIFTQMTRMLDVLEAFLNYHGHRYLRLDGTTRVEMRQLLMDRFNADERIFVFILSTRSGGIGVNLTGADTVIFYDSDWNPTMDAQAQDRCHRIGQTRDVHIYRLVSEKTVEENILKKANQKRMLGDVAIEGGNFTTASLQQGTITDLFAEPSGLESLVEIKRTRQAAASPSTVTATLAATAVAGNLNEKQFEQALCQAEDAEDVQAAAVASEEAGAELAEFDESIPWDEREAELRKQQADKSSKVEQEIALLEKELTPVERFAVMFLEQTDEQFSEEAVKEAEMDIEQAKTEWELNRLKSRREEEERRAELEEDDMLYTYSKEDGMNQAFKDSVTGENMPMWCPPTPPHSENDMYVDQSMCFLYDSAIMTEAQLPPVHVKKEKKRRHESQQLGVPKKKARLVAEDVPQTQPGLTNRPPRSLFDRPQLLKMRREKTLLRHGVTGQLSMKMGASGNLQRPGSSDSSHQDQPEWLIHEDWSLLQAVQTLLQLPLNLVVTSPAHIPNWDLVSDIVSTTSRIYRSAKQCKARYETVIIPREEGKLTFDPNPRKPSKKIPKSVYKTKGNKPMRTGQLYTQDSGSSVTTLHAFRFDCIKNVASKRTPTLRPTLVNPTLKNPKHAAVIADSGIQYDSPMNPEEVAKIRQERIKSEKTKAEQQRTIPSQATVRAQSTVQLQQFPSSGAATAIINPATKQALQGTAMSAVSIGRNNSIVVSNSLGALANRKLPNQATSVISGVTSATQTAGGRKMTVQEIQQLRSSSTTVAQFMKQVQAGGGSVTGVSQGGSQRTITVQQGPQPISIGGASKHQQQQFSQLNILSQHQAKQRTTGATLVAQRTASGATQLLSGQQIQQSGETRVPTLVKTVSSGATGSGTTIPVSTGVNISVTLPQQQKALSAISKAGLTGNPPHQFRQIQLLHNKPVTRPQLQKLSLSHPQLVGKSGASVQIVQQKIGGKQIGVQQIQQLIKQQQAQQHAQIITTPGSSGATASASGGQTIIATSQLITPANMHATITKMSAPNSGSAASGGVSNVTVSLARPVITTHTNPVAIVPSAGSSLVTQSPTKLVATSTARPTTHRMATGLTGIVAGGNTGSTSMVSLASVTVQGLQSQPSVSASLMGHRSLSSSTERTVTTIATSQGHQQGTPSSATVRAPTVVTNPVSSSGGTTVLHQTILTNKPAGSSSHASVSTMSVVQALATSTPSIVAQPVAPTVVVPVDPQLVTLANVGNTVTVATTPAPDPPASGVSSPAASSTIRADSPESSDLQATAPDSTRTYAMRPRKTN